MQQQKFFFILLGDTRTGKSSFTNQHAGKILAQVGLPNGHSTTKRISIYENGSVTYVDTMGFNDTDNTFTNKEIREHIVDKICAMGNDDAKIIFVIFESFESDTLRLQDTLKNLEKLFGVTAVESTILVLTKHNIFADPEETTDKRQKVEAICNRLNLKYLDWESHYEDYQVPTEIHMAQMTKFSNLANEVKAASLEEVNKHRQYIQAEATKRRDNFKEFDSKQVTVNEEKEEAYQEPVTRYRSTEVVNTIPYTEQEPRKRTVQKTKVENYKETIQVQVPETYSYKKRRGGLAGMLGEKKWVTDTRWVTKSQEVTKQRTVPYTEEETYYVTVNKVRTEKKTVQEPYQDNVTKYRKIMVPVTKTVQVEKPKPAIEYFISQVKEEVKAQILKKYAGKV